MSHQALPTFCGMDIHCVQAGTEIEHNGKTLTVTETAAVHKGRNIYCTEKVFEKIKAQARAAQADPRSKLSL